MTVRFALGQIVATPGALAVLEQSKQTAAEFLVRHASGDWSEICEQDQQENEFSLLHGFRLVSAYTLRNGVKLWIISEADRSATTILLPEEY